MVIITEIIENVPKDKKLGVKWRNKNPYPYEAPMHIKIKTKVIQALKPYYDKWLGTHKTILKKKT